MAQKIMKRFNTQLTLSALTLGLASAIGLPSAPAQAVIPFFTASYNNYFSDVLPLTNTTITVTPLFQPTKVCWGTALTPAGKSCIETDEPTGVNLPSYAPADSVFTNVANITHENNVIALGSSITGLKYVSELTLTPPTLPATLTAIFTFGFAETPNSGTCAAVGTPPCPDIWVMEKIMIPALSIDAPPTSPIFATVIPGGLGLALPLPLDPTDPSFDPTYMYMYVLELSNSTATGGLRVLTPTECAALTPPQASGCIGFTTNEDGTTTVPFFAQIDVVKKNVPEPSASAALVGAGLVSFGLLRKRKQNS
jgi:hypothetical protein